MNGQILFDPLLPWALIAAMSALAFLIVGIALWRGLSGWPFRALAAVALIAALANPSVQNEDRDRLSDIIVLVVDETSSQKIKNREVQTTDAVETLRSQIDALENTELRIVRLRDGANNTGSALVSAVNDALANEPRNRIAGVFTLTDGQIHDADVPMELPAPFHVLLSGSQNDWDRKLTILDAPAFAILDEEITLKLRVDDLGAAPNADGQTTLAISIDGGPAQTFDVPLGEVLEMPLTLTHGGRNVVHFVTPKADGELTARNNEAVVQINGVRDRLRVLLVSGEPHAGERTWRNLLKSDSSVDLVHFTILRPPEKQDGVPSNELSLIAFPTRELFLEKIDEFDLIVFDRYKRRGILPGSYFDNIRLYVENGGAVLIAAGPDFAAAESLYRSPLADIIPAEPTARVIEEGYLPTVSELGRRHPVTQGLDATPSSQDTPWGRWLRLVEVRQTSGHTVMTGMDERPLLILDRVGEGRVALLASDHAWLWSRGYEGGGPQAELLRRLAHWMMKEPELEEDALTAISDGETLTITRRSLDDVTGFVTVTRPDGSTVQAELNESDDGRFNARVATPEIGLYRLEHDQLTTVIGVGPASPKEFENTIATSDILNPIAKASGGGVTAIESGFPSIRLVRDGRPAVGRGWVGITPRNAFVTQSVTLTSLVPAWLFLLMSAGLVLAAWLREGRR